MIDDTLSWYTQFGMEPKFNTSFIPKKSLQADVNGPSVSEFAERRDTYGPGFSLALLIFIVSIVASIAVFAYTVMIDRTIEKKITELENLKNSFSEENIEMLIRADNHIKQAKKITTEHVAVSELFNELERITLKKVQYVGMEYAGVPNENSLFTLSGFSQNFQDVALQTTQYRSSKSLRSPIVRELERLEAGPVFFSIEVTADPRLVSFANALENAKQPNNPEVDEEVEAPQAPETAQPEEELPPTITE